MIILSWLLKLSLALMMICMLLLPAVTYFDYEQALHFHKIRRSLRTTQNICFTRNLHSC